MRIFAQLHYKPCMKLIKNLSEFDAQACALTIGFFDGVHAGHCQLIEQLKQEAAKRSLPSVVFTFSNHPREGMQSNYVPKLLTTNSERIELLEKTGVDYVIEVPFNMELASYSSRFFMRKVLVEQLHTRFLLVGHDHHFGCDREHGFEYYAQIATEFGMEVQQSFPFLTEGVRVSSSLIRKNLEEGGVIAAQRMLGYTYFLEGIVVPGHKVGRTLGFPTANVAISDVRKLIPREGVYAVEVQVEGETRRRYGMLNIGVRPTFVSQSVAKSIEVNVFDYSQDIYQKSIKIYFVEYHRPEIKFDTPDKLTHQLRQDRDQIAEYFEHHA